MVLVGRLLDPVTDFTREGDFVEFSFSLQDEGFDLGLASVVGPRKTWLCLFDGHVPDDGATKCSDNCTLFAALKESAKKDAHPFPRLDTFPVPKACFLIHNLDVESPNLFAKASKEVRLLSKVFVLRAHLAELLICGIGFGYEGFSATMHSIESFLPGSDSFQTLPNMRDVGSEK